jgi:2-polyprenyl-3-methyl-5-hydroxy-6-metoxy-1,4-benzoquinol methylase
MPPQSLNEMKTGRSLVEEKALTKDAYFNSDYAKVKQLDSQLNQFTEIYRLKPKTVLEIGPGNGFLTHLLRSFNIDVTTFDINPNLEPDVVGNILKLDQHFPDGSFDLVIAAEVLEHVEYRHFRDALKLLQSVTKKNAIITLPRAFHTIIDLQFKWKVFFSRPRKIGLFIKRPRTEITEIHHWEIDHSKATRLSKIRQEMKAIFQIQNDYTFRRNRYHHFFILEKA